MTITVDTTNIGGLVLYHPIIEIWSGTVKVRRDVDLADASSSLPPPEIISDGRKRLVPTDPLKPLLNVRKGVERLLKGVGFPFMGGVAIPESETSHVEAELPKLQQAFSDALDDLCANLDLWYARLEAQHPQWQGLLRASRLTPSEVRSRCKFDIAAFKAAMPDASASREASQRFGRFAEAAFPDLLKDIAGRAQAMLDTSFSGRVEVTQRQVTPVRNLVAKLDTFGFLDHRVTPMADALAAQLTLIPATGPLDPAQTSMVVSMLKTLSDPEAILANGEELAKRASASLPAIQTVSPALTALPTQQEAPTQAPNAEAAAQEQQPTVAPAAVEAVELPALVIRQDEAGPPTTPLKPVEIGGGLMGNIGF